MKQIITAAALSLVLAGCGGSDDPEPTPSPTPASGDGGATAVPAATPTAVPAATPTAVPASTPTAVPAATPTAVPAATPTAVPAATPTAVPAATPTSTPTAVPVAASTCPANATTDAAFVDTFVNNGVADRNWENTDPTTLDTAKALTVAAIAAEFNAGRANDPTVKEKLKMPSQSVWNAFNTSQKMLYLVNSERCARGLLPFEGIDPRMVATAQAWADNLVANHFVGGRQVQLTHGADGSAHPNGPGTFKRLENAGVNVNSGGNADFFAFGENLATFLKGTTATTTASVTEPEARSVYGYMYGDKDNGNNYGHRKFNVAGLTNNYNSLQNEGLFGAAKKSRQDDFVQGASTFKLDNVVTVMHVFDPNVSYTTNSGETITPAPAHNGPTSQADCRVGSFQAGSGTNFGTCN